MTFKSTLCHLLHKHAPACNMPLDAWCRIDGADPTRFVHKVELCTALTTGRDAWGTPVDKMHRHTLLRVYLSPVTSYEKPEDVLLVERVLSTGGSYHSVTPIDETFTSGGTLFHPDVYDRACVTSGTSTGLAHHLEVERTINFGDGSDDRLRLTQVQFAQIIRFVSRTTMLVCAGGDCRFQSRSFAFTCAAALTPTLPTPTVVHKAIKGERTQTKQGVEMDDSVFELNAEALLVQAPWLIKDEASVQALKWIGALKDEPRERAQAILAH